MNSHPHEPVSICGVEFIRPFYGFPARGNWRLHKAVPVRMNSTRTIMVEFIRPYKHGPLSLHLGLAILIERIVHNELFFKGFVIIVTNGPKPGGNGAKAGSLGRGFDVFRHIRRMYDLGQLK